MRNGPNGWVTERTTLSFVEVTIMGLFAKAAAKVTSEVGGAKKKKASTTWLVGGKKDDARQEKLHNAVHQLVTLAGEAKTIDAKMKVHKATVYDYANDMFFRSYADGECFPETPMQVQNGDGEKVTFVVQDRAGQYPVKDEQVEQLIAILGEDAAKALMFEETKIGFNRDILALPGVTEAVEKALERAIGKLVADEVLTAEQAEALIQADMKRSFKSDIPQRLVQICGTDTTKMAAVMDALGSTCVRYVKP